MANIVIRAATLDDLDVLAANNCAMARETEGRDLVATVVRAGTRAMLEDPSKGFYVVAERDDAVVGQLMITFEWSDWRNKTFLLIQSVYVTPSARRCGVFRALFKHVISTAGQWGDVSGVRLYMAQHNEAARRAYESLGLRRTGYDVYELDFVFG